VAHKSLPPSSPSTYFKLNLLILWLYTLSNSIIFKPCNQTNILLFYYRYRSILNLWGTKSYPLIKKKKYLVNKYKNNLTAFLWLENYILQYIFTTVYTVHTFLLSVTSLSYQDLCNKSVFRIEYNCYKPYVWGCKFNYLSSITAVQKS